MSSNMEKKYVYVIYDPLCEKVLCVHGESGMECNKCKKIRKDRHCAYFLEEHKRLIKIGKKY